MKFERAVGPQRQLVAAVAEEGQPLGIAHDDIELVAVDHEIAPPVGGGVHGLVLDLDAAEVGTAVLAQRLVVVAGYEHDARALARLAQQLLDDVVVRLRPDGAAPDPPEVDDVAHEVDGLGVVFLQEIEQQIGLRCPRPQMHVRDKQRAIFGHAGPFRAMLQLPSHLSGGT